MAKSKRVKDYLKKINEEPQISVTILFTDMTRVDSWKKDVIPRKSVSTSDYPIDQFPIFGFYKPISRI